MSGDYKVGDVVNGHVLDDDLVWRPVAEQPQQVSTAGTAAEERQAVRATYRYYWVPQGLAAAIFLVVIMVSPGLFDVSLAVLVVTFAVSTFFLVRASRRREDEELLALVDRRLAETKYDSFGASDPVEKVLVPAEVTIDLLTAAMSTEQRAELLSAIAADAAAGNQYARYQQMLLENSGMDTPGEWVSLEHTTSQDEHQQLILSALVLIQLMLGTRVGPSRKRAKAVMSAAKHHRGNGNDLARACMLLMARAVALGGSPSSPITMSAAQQ